MDGTGIYVAGCTCGTLLGQSSSGNSDAFVVRLDAIDGDDDGGWTRQFGSAGTTERTGSRWTARGSTSPATPAARSPARSAGRR